MELHYGNLIEKAKAGEFDVIIHGANCFHTMGAGIAKHIKTNFPEAYEADKKTGYGDKNKVGTFSEATVEINGHKLTIINAYTQYRYGNERDQFEYDSFPQLLQDIKNKHPNLKFGIPLIGCGLAGGNEPRILKMIKENFEGLNYKLVEIDLNRKLKLEEDKPNQPEAPQYTYFFHLTSPFSNFHPAKMEYKSLTFISNEQFMMYSKAKNFKDEASAAKILELNQTPIAQDFINGKITREQIVNNKDWADTWNQLMMSVKKLGRGVQNYDDVLWTNKREKIVLFGARLKFTQNEDLKQILLNTGNTLMVEASPYDKIWGIGLSASDAKKTSPDKWPGLNLLGKVLDVLKLEIQKSLTQNNDINSKKKALNNFSVQIENKEKVLEKINFNPLDYIRVVNVKGNKENQAKADERVIAVHRANPTLGNPFVMKDKSDAERDRVLEAYKMHLMKDLNAQGSIYKLLNKIADDIIENKEKIALSCWCAPKACHAHEIAKSLAIIINEKLLLQEINLPKISLNNKP